MTNPDQTTDKYAELRTRAENIRDDIEVAQTREVSTFLEDACDAVIRDLLAALAETQAELGRSREALSEMQGVVERQVEELAEVHEDAFCEIGFKINDGSELDGWWDSAARSDACEHGEWLVEHGLWERHPNGYGRRWFYRPIEAALAARTPSGDSQGEGNDE